MNLQEFALQLISKNPNIANNPALQNMIEAIRTNNSSLGEQIAKNICNTYGLSYEEAGSKAKRFFGIS